MKNNEQLTLFDGGPNITAKQKEAIRQEILTVELVKDVGFAKVSRYHRVQGGGTPFEFLFDAKIAVVYIAKMDEVIDKYGKWYVVTLNNFLKQTNNRVVEVFKNHELFSKGVIDERITANLVGKVSFRQLAVLAGLGTIGKNESLLHPRYGPNVLIGLVLTNSYMPPDEPLIEELCSNCGICLDECPVGAINDNFFDRKGCKDRRKVLGKGCGTPCITDCPVGQKS